MQQRKFSREYKLEAAKLVRERGSAFRRPPAIWMFMRMSCASVLWPVCIQRNQIIAYARWTNPMNAVNVFSHRNATIAFQLVKKAFNLMALLVQPPVDCWDTGTCWIGLDLSRCLEIAGNEGP